MLILQSEVFFQSKIRISWGIGVSLRDVQEKPVAGRARVANILSPADYFFLENFYKIKIKTPQPHVNFYLSSSCRLFETCSLYEIGTSRI